MALSPTGGNMRKRTLTTFAVSVVLVVGMIGVGGLFAAASSGASSTPYRIAFIGDLSGSLAGSGHAYLEGIKASAKNVNASGGIQGHPIVVTSYDDQGDPTSAVNDLEQAITSNRPNLVWCGTSTAECLAMMPVLTQNKILADPIVQGTALNDGSKWPYLISASPDESAVNQTMVQYLKQSGAHLVGFFHADDADGETNNTMFLAAAKAAGVKVVSVAYSATAVDVSGPLQQLINSKIDSLVVDAYGVSASYIVQARTKLGVKLPTLGTFAFASSDLSSFTSTPDLNGVKIAIPTVMTYEPPSQQSTGFKTMFAALKKNGGIGTGLPMNLYSIPWDSVQALKLATAKAKSIDPAKVTKAFLALHVPAKGTNIATYNTYALNNASRLTPTTTADFKIVNFGPLVNGQYGAP
jgi:ABC-type branched-subunit amino acid transport system substrate-binding protein